MDLTPAAIDACDGVGGTEIAAWQIAKWLAKFGYKISFGGQVQPGYHANVQWLSIEQCHQQHFDLVIAASYLHYLKEFNNFDKSIFWFHNTDWHMWFRGQAVIGSEWLQDSRLTAFVALTDWHRQQLQRDHDLQQPVHVIGNAIDRQTFANHPIHKKPASFIYSSSAERGLDRLLNMWPDVRTILPNATLQVFSPGYDPAQQPKDLPGVQFMGTVDQLTLHKAQQASEYWLHPTDYEETYGITALEMQYAGAIPITTNSAALTEVVADRGFLMDLDETDEQFLRMIKVLHGSADLKTKLRNKAHQWAKQQTWFNRAMQWHQLIQSL